MSAFFAIFTPFPLLTTRLRLGAKWFALAVFTNAALVVLASGWTGLGGFLILGFVVASTLAAGFERGWRVEKTALVSFVGILMSGMALLAVHAVIHRVGIMAELQAQLAVAVEMMSETVVSGPEGLRTGILGGADLAEWKEGLRTELPGALSVFCLVLVVLNMILAIRLNPAGIREKGGIGSGFLLHWRAPEYLVWPTLLAGFFLLVDIHAAGWLPSAVFKTLMAVYALQGLSILGFFLELWRIRGAFRTAALVIAIFLMTPLLLSLGFFDLWFDFRSKFRQS